MHQSITACLSKTIWPRWASRQFLGFPIVQTLFPMTFVYYLSSETVVMRQLKRWKRLLRRSLTLSHKRTSMGPSRSYWNGTTAAGGDYFEGELTFMRVLSIKVPIRKKSGNLSKAPYIFVHIHTCISTWGLQRKGLLRRELSLHIIDLTNVTLFKVYRS